MKGNKHTHTHIHTHTHTHTHTAFASIFDKCQTQSTDSTIITINHIDDKYMRRLCTHGKLIIMNNQIVITTALYAKIIKTLFSGHHGVSSMIACSNTTIYWPGINKEVRDTRCTCHLCNETYSQQKEPLMLTHQHHYFQTILSWPATVI